MHLLEQSKYGPESIEILNKYHQRGDISAIERFANDRIARDFYEEIVRILENNQYTKRSIDNVSLTSAPPTSIHSNLEQCTERPG